MKRNFLPFHIPFIDEDEIKAVAETLRSGWLTTGPKAQQFERAFAEYVGARHAVAVSSCTAALHLALDAVGLQAGDEVLTTPFTFAATAEAILYFGAKPVFVDIRRDTFNMDSEQLGAKITPKARAVLPVHYAGQPCQAEQILEIARHYGLKVVEDAAHALPAKRRFGNGNWKSVGTIGDLTCFSFYATKTITTGEGGMVTTEDDEYAGRIRVMRLHGINYDAWKRYASEGSWYYEINAPGYKYNMSDVLATLGIHQLMKCDWFYEVRKRYAAAYTSAFSELEGVIPPYEDPNSQHAWHLYVILLNLEALRIDRNQFVNELKSLNIGTSVHFIPLHLHPYYRSAFGYERGDFPNAEWVYDRCLSLPLYPKMAEEDVWYVIEAVRDMVKRHKR